MVDRCRYNEDRMFYQPGLKGGDNGPGLSTQYSVLSTQYSVLSRPEIGVVDRKVFCPLSGMERQKHGTDCTGL